MICDNCKFLYSVGYSFCNCGSANTQLIIRTIFHEERTKNYKPAFKQLNSLYAYQCALSELQFCVFHKRKLFSKRKAVPGNFTHSDVKDVFKIIGSK